MFHLPLAPTLVADPDNTPERRAFEVLVRAVEHGLASLRLARPQFPWSGLDGLVDEAVTKIMGLRPGPAG